MNESNLKRPERSRDPARSSDIPVFTIEALLAQHREAIILHGSERYRLRLTAKGKLILTK